MNTYTAQIQGRPVQVEGWDSEGSLVLEHGHRFAFQELHQERHDFRTRRLLFAVSLRQQDGRWWVEGEDLVEWVNQEGRRAESARNRERAAAGLPAVGLFDTHIDLSLQEFIDGVEAPDQTHELRRLDADERLIPYLLLNKALESLSMEQVAQCCGAAFFEGSLDPILLRSCHRVRGVAEDAQALLMAGESVTKAVTGVTEQLKDVVNPLRDIYSDPRMVAVRKSALARGVPERLLDEAISLWHTSKFPSVRELEKRMASIRGYTKAKRRTQISEYLRIVRTLMEDAGLIDPTRPRAPRFREADSRHTEDKAIGEQLGALGFVPDKNGNTGFSVTRKGGQ